MQLYTTITPCDVYQHLISMEVDAAVLILLKKFFHSSITASTAILEANTIQSHITVHTVAQQPRLDALRAIRTKQTKFTFHSQM